MTSQLKLIFPKESYSTVTGPCSATSKKCREFVAKDENAGIKFRISTTDDGKTGTMSICKKECTKSYTIQHPTIDNNPLDGSSIQASVFLDHNKGHLTKITNELAKYNIYYTPVDEGETQDVLSEVFI